MENKTPGVSPEQQRIRNEINAYLSSSSSYQNMQNLLQQIQAAQGQLTSAAGDRPGIALIQQTSAEKKAGVVPPGYEGTRDVKTGKLLDEFKMDPYGGEALQKLKGQAFAEGLSPWAQAQLQSQQMGEQDARGAAGRQQMQAMSAAQGQLARTGGMTGGAAALLARQGSRDMLGANQQIARQGMGQRLGIEQQDIDRKNQLLGKFGDLETQASGQNIDMASQDINRRALFDMERYRQQMQAWAAKESADATRASGGGGGKK